MISRRRFSIRPRKEAVMHEISSIIKRERVFKSKRDRRLAKSLLLGQVRKSGIANLGFVENLNMLCMVLLIPFGRFPTALPVKAVQATDNPHARACLLMQEVKNDLPQPGPPCFNNKKNNKIIR